MSEYDWPGTVIVCSPSPDDDGRLQHDGMVQKLRALGVQVLAMPHVPNLPAQEFTRDVGFVIGGVLFSGLLHEHRAGERNAFHQFCEAHHLPYTTLTTHIEGGDVIVDGRRVFLGQSGRTAADAAAELQKTLRRLFPRTASGNEPPWSVIPMPFPVRFLHLDCVFCPLSPTTCLAHMAAFDAPTQAIIRAHYPEIVNVNVKQQADLACNVVGLGPGVHSSGQTSVVCCSEALGVGSKLEATLALTHRFRLHPLHLDSFIARRGSVRCLTLPLRNLSLRQTS